MQKGHLFQVQGRLLVSTFYTSDPEQEILVKESALVFDRCLSWEEPGPDVPLFSSSELASILISGAPPDALDDEDPILIKCHECRLPIHEGKVVRHWSLRPRRLCRHCWKTTENGQFQIHGGGGRLLQQNPLGGGECDEGFCGDDLSCGGDSAATPPPSLLDDVSQVISLMQDAIGSSSSSSSLSAVSSERNLAVIPCRNAENGCDFKGSSTASVDIHTRNNCSFAICCCPWLGCTFKVTFLFKKCFLFNYEFSSISMHRPQPPSCTAT